MLTGHEKRGILDVNLSTQTRETTVQRELEEDTGVRRTLVPKNFSV